MNKRIRELAEQAGILTEVWHKDSLGNGYKVPNFEAEKFAELIIQECQFAIVSRTDLPAHERKLYNNVLKQHFGVEE